MMSFHDLPAEMQISIFKYLNPSEVDSVKQVCWSFNRLIYQNSIRLARHEYKAKLDQNCQFFIESNEEKRPFRKTFEMSDSLADILKHVQLTSLTIKGPIDINVINSFMDILYATKQFQIHSFIMQSVNIECHIKCGRLFQLLATANCHAISLIDCRLACGFTNEQSAQLHDLCQFTVKNCNPTNELGILGKYLSKLAYDMRFKSRRNSLPFYAEAPNLKISEICQFIKTWIAIFEAPAFAIYVNNCEPDFKYEFLKECATNELHHHQLEFKSKSHPRAHIKVVFDDRQRKMQIYPIKDVPPRIDRSFCTARQFRDFR